MVFWIFVRQLNIAFLFYSLVSFAVEGKKMNFKIQYSTEVSILSTVVSIALCSCRLNNSTMVEVNSMFSIFAVQVLNMTVCITVTQFKE